MKHQQILRNDLGSNGISKAHLPKGHLNGVLLSLKPSHGGPFTIADLNKIHDIKVRAYFVENETHHLITNIPLSVFIALSNIDYGSTGSMSRLLTSGLIQSADGLETFSLVDGNDNSEEKNAWNYMYKNDELVLYINLGSIYCDDGNEFHIALEGMNGFSHSAYAVSRVKDPFGFINYNLDLDLNENHQNVDRLLLYTNTSKRDMLIYLKSDEYSFESDFEGFRAATQIFNEIENTSVGLITQLWKSSVNIPQDVWVQLTNNNDDKLNDDINTTAIVTMRLSFPKGLGYHQSRRNLSKLKDLQRNFEVKNPQKAIEMIKAGAIPSFEYLSKLK